MTDLRTQLKTQIFERFRGQRDDLAPHDFWFDPRPRAGLRVTKLALEILNDNELKSYEFVVPRDLVRRPWSLLRLDRYLQYPYHVDSSAKAQLTFFSDRDAIMASLYGDVEKFIKSLG